MNTRLVARILAPLAMLTLPAPAAVAAAHPIKVGQPAPDADLMLVDGSKVKLSALHGQVVVLNFWATWCVPCRKELPLLDAYARARAAAGLKVFAVTTEDSVPLYQLKPLFAALTIAPVRRLKGPYADMGALPTNIVIDRQGVVRYAAAGAFDLADLNATLVPLLSEAAP